MPWGFIELLVIRLLVTFCSGFNQTIYFKGSIEAILARSLAILETSSYIYLLLYRVIYIGRGEGYGSIISKLEDNSKLLEDTFYEIFSHY